jgi:hypothetical protein
LLLAGKRQVAGAACTVTCTVGLACSCRAANAGPKLPSDVSQRRLGTADLLPQSQLLELHILQLVAGGVTLQALSLLANR